VWHCVSGPPGHSVAVTHWTQVPAPSHSLPLF